MDRAVSRLRPRFIKSQSFGYLMSAMFGGGVGWLTLISKPMVLRRRPQGGDRDATLLCCIDHSRIYSCTVSRLASEQVAARSGLLQNIDPRVSLIDFYR